MAAYDQYKHSLLFQELQQHNNSVPGNDFQGSIIRKQLDRQ